MYGEIGDSYSDLLLEASNYARRNIAASVSEAEQAEKDAKLRMYLMAGGAGLAALLLLVMVLRRD